MPDLKLEFLPGLYALHRLPPDAPLPPLPGPPAFTTISRSADELSVLCPSEVELDSAQRVDSFVCLRVAGTLDFSLVGVLADLTRCLAQAAVSVFAVSTFDTDYLLVQADQRDAATQALRDAGYTWVEPTSGRPSR